MGFSVGLCSRALGSGCRGLRGEVASYYKGHNYQNGVLGAYVTARAIVEIWLLLLLLLLPLLLLAPALPLYTSPNPEQVLIGGDDSGGFFRRVC